MEKEIFGLLHIILTCMSSGYGLVTSKNWIDKYYIYYILTVLLSWTFFNGECLLSLFHKQFNKTKIDDVRATDMIAWFGNVRIHDTFIFICSMLTMFSIIRVFYRNYIPIIFIFLFIVMSIIYMKLIKYYNNRCNSLPFLLVQTIFKIYCIFLLIYVYYNV